MPELVTFQYDAKVPASWQWQVGVQMALPWASSLDVSYVGNHGYNRLGGLQGGNAVNLNAVDIGAAYLPQNQDPTIAAASTVPGANAYTANLLRAYRGLGTIAQNTTEFWDTYHSIQTSFNRRFQNGFSFGVNYTLGLSLEGNTGLHAAPAARRGRHRSRSAPTRPSTRSCSSTCNLQRHVLKANAVWDMPDLATSAAGAGKKIARLHRQRLAGLGRLDWPTPATATTWDTASRTTART